MKTANIEDLPRPERRRILREFRKSLKKAEHEQKKWGTGGAEKLLASEFVYFAAREAQ